VNDWVLSNEPSIPLPSIHELSSGRLAMESEVPVVGSSDFVQMIETAGAHSVVDAMCERFEVSATAMRGVISHAGPFFFRAHQHWMDRPGGGRTLNILARSGGPQQFADKPGLVAASLSKQEGRKFLRHLLPDKSVPGLFVQRVAVRLDMTPEKIEEMMPHLAALFVGCLCKSITSHG
jgi:hypothetical protein